MHDSDRYSQISALHLVQTYITHSKTDLNDFETILNFLVIKLCTKIITSDVSISLQALDILDNLLSKYEEKIKGDSKKIIK